VSLGLQCFRRVYNSGNSNRLLLVYEFHGKIKTFSILAIYIYIYITFMSPSIAIDIFLIINQTHQLCKFFHVTKLCMFRAFSLPIIRRFLPYIRHWQNSRRVRMELQCSSILTLLGCGHRKLHEFYQCRMYSRKHLMMGRENARNM
jgi:hypothetical protein